MVKRNAIATKLTKRCTQTQKQAFDVAVRHIALGAVFLQQNIMSMRFCKAFHMLSQANFPDEGSEKAVSFCDKTKLGGWASII